MYDCAQTPSENLENRRDRFRASIRRKKIDQLIRDKREAIVDLDLEAWQKEKKSTWDQFQQIAERLNTTSPGEWLHEIEALAVLRQEWLNQSFTLWLDTHVIDNLIRGVTSAQSPEAVRSLAAIILSNIVYQYTINQKQGHQLLRDVLLQGGIVDFLVEHIQGRLQRQEELKWDECLQNMLYLISNLIFDSSLFRNRFISLGVAAMAIGLYMRARNVKHHSIVSWLTNNIIRPPLSQDAPPNDSALGSLTPILTDYLSSPNQQLVQEALVGFQALLKSEAGSIKEYFYVGGLISRLFELMEGSVLIHSLMAIKVLTLLILSNNGDKYANEVVRAGIFKHVENLLARTEQITNKHLAELFKLVSSLCEEASQTIESLLQGSAWPALIEMSSSHVENDTFKVNEGEAAMLGIGSVVQVLTFPQAQAMLRRVPLLNFITYLMQRFQDTSPTVISEGLKAIDLIVLVLSKYQEEKQLIMPHTSGLENLLNALVDHPNHSISAKALALYELLRIPTLQDTE